ncbi:MAG: glucose 1-dehydrogenase [Deltaproteobacteria bacterium]|nr:glucose 1-dehydrogenase [Deltaproteobacteria bacterium]MBI3075853.1 glucose 1-dehydrogenase [Deltaproteobacteria bacterium]
MRLQDRVALVTGGASGIGRAIVRGYAREGAHVVIADVQPAAEAEQEVVVQGRRALAVKVDVARREEVEALVRQVLDAFGTIDILVNCAGVQSNQPFLEATDEDFDRVLAVDLKGTFNCAQAVARGMIERKRGKIINIASQSGALYVRNLAPQYHAAKAGVIHLTRVLAVELGRHGINVNAIAPALVLTPPLKARWEASPEMRAYHLGKVALGRAATPEDIVGPAIFLASSDSDYVTGHTLFVDGGFTAQ